MEHVQKGRATGGEPTSLQKICPEFDHFNSQPLFQVPKPSLCSRLRSLSIYLRDKKKTISLRTHLSYKLWKFYLAVLRETDIPITAIYLLKYKSIQKSTWDEFIELQIYYFYLSSKGLENQSPSKNKVLHPQNTYDAD